MSQQPPRAAQSAAGRSGLGGTTSALDNSVSGILPPENMRRPTAPSLWANQEQSGLSNSGIDPKEGSGSALFEGGFQPAQAATSQNWRKAAPKPLSPPPPPPVGPPQKSDLFGDDDDVTTPPTTGPPPAALNAGDLPPGLLALASTTSKANAARILGQPSPPPGGSERGSGSEERRSQQQSPPPSHGASRRSGGSSRVSPIPTFQQQQQPRQAALATFHQQQQQQRRNTTPPPLRGFADRTQSPPPGQHQQGLPSSHHSGGPTPTQIDGWNNPLGTPATDTTDRLALSRSGGAQSRSRRSLTPGRKDSPLQTGDLVQPFGAFGTTAGGFQAQQQQQGPSQALDRFRGSLQAANISSPPTVPQQQHHHHGGGGGMRGGHHHSHHHSHHNHNHQQQHQNDQQLALSRTASASLRALGWSVKDIQGQCYEFACDAEGSRLIQVLLEDSWSLSAIFCELQPHLPGMICHPFGNYAAQRFVELGRSTHRKAVVEAITDRAVYVAKDTYGCRVFQRLLDCCVSPQQQPPTPTASGDAADSDSRSGGGGADSELVALLERVVGELDGSVDQLVVDQNGNHVIQRILDRLPPDQFRTAFIVRAFVGNLSRLGMHCYGCRVVQKVFEVLGDGTSLRANSDAATAVSDLVQDVLSRVEDLIADQYGNYVVQHFLINGSRMQRAAVIARLTPHVGHLACNKFASNVMERVFEYATEAERDHFVITLTADPPNGVSPPAIVRLMKDQYANYVVQKIVEAATQAQRDFLQRAIQPNILLIRESVYGQHILARLERIGWVPQGSSGLPPNYNPPGRGGGGGGDWGGRGGRGGGRGGGGRGGGGRGGRGGGRGGGDRFGGGGFGQTDRGFGGQYQNPNQGLPGQPQMQQQFNSNPMLGGGGGNWNPHQQQPLMMFAQQQPQQQQQSLLLGMQQQHQQQASPLSSNPSSPDIAQLLQALAAQTGANSPHMLLGQQNLSPNQQQQAQQQSQQPNQQDMAAQLALLSQHAAFASMHLQQLQQQQQQPPTNLAQLANGEGLKGSSSNNNGPSTTQGGLNWPAPSGMVPDTTGGAGSEGSQQQKQRFTHQPYGRN